MDLYSTNRLLGIIESLPPSPTDLLDRYFATVIVEDSEEIHYDKSIRYRIMAPFVSPIREGRIVEERGQTVETFKPAYLKPLTPLDPTRPLKRLAGEALTGTLTPIDRRARLVTQTLEDHRAYIDRRLEWMAAQVLLAAAVTVVGDGYASQNVNFQRAAALTVTLAGGNLWSDSAATPIKNLHAWNTLAMQQVGGAPIRDFIMDPDAWDAFRSHAEVEKRLDTRRDLGATVNATAAQREGLRYMGTIETFDIYVYQAWYEETIGTLVPFFASGTVVGASPAIEGVQQFGAIVDEEALVALRYFPSSWIERNPSRRYVMTQSAPLVVPGRVNASLKASVL